MDMQIIDDCKRAIQESEVVLIGFGKEFNVHKDEILKDSKILDGLKLHESPLDELERQWIDYTLVYMELKSGENPIINEKINVYNKVAEYLVGLNKNNHFIVTTCNDDIITRSSLDRERMVAPCGTLSYMKCDSGCFKKVYDTEKVYENIFSIIQKYEAESDNEMMWNELKEAMPQCPMCKRVMSVNMYKTNNYSEEGYRNAWDSYTAWLQRTLNRKLVMIELGEGFDTPTVIRWPFEKVAAINNKATLIRVNKNFWQISEDIVAKAVPVKMSGAEFLNNMEV